MKWRKKIRFLFFSNNHFFFFLFFHYHSAFCSSFLILRNVIDPFLHVVKGIKINVGANDYGASSFRTTRDKGKKIIYIYDDEEMKPDDKNVIMRRNHRVDLIQFKFIFLLNIKIERGNGTNWPIDASLSTVVFLPIFVQSEDRKL